MRWCGLVWLVEWYFLFDQVVVACDALLNFSFLLRFIVENCSEKLYVLMYFIIIDILDIEYISSNCKSI